MVSPEISLFDSDQLKNLTTNEIGDVWQKIDMAATASIFNANFDDKSKKLLAHNFTDILFACRFNYEKCDASDFEWSFDPYYGNCYSFNTGFNSSGHRVKLRESSVSGWLFGLQLELYVNHNENLSLFNDAKGLLVRINNSSYLIDQNLDGIRISPGLRTNLAISR
jgi:amiloride-sensitive sodium channel subunit beta